MSEFTEERLVKREINRKRLQDIIAGRAIIEVLPDHSNILTRVQKEEIDE